jgi:hypothetical protein
MIRRLVSLVRRGPKEDGEALIFALIVVAVIAIIVTAGLQFSGSGLLTTPQLRDVRNSVYYSQGALDGAINAIRGSSEVGTGGAGSTNCPLTPSSATVLTTPGPADSDGNDPGAYGSGHQYTVSCAATDTSGGGQSDQPAFAIQTLGQSATGDCTSDHIQASICTTGNHLLTVDGGVFATGSLTVDSTSGNDKTALGVNGSVYATGTCTGRVSTTDVAGSHCPNYVDTGHIGADPAYPGAVSSSAGLTSLIGTDTPANLLLGADPMPTCTANPSRVTEFWPGYYSELPTTLVTMQNTDAQLAQTQQCTGSVWWFHPGIYYFDYQGNWTIGSPHAVTVIGGTSTGTWSIPGGCASFTNPANPVSDGVQFEFGGSSQVTVGSQGGIELCGPTTSQAAAYGTPTHQHIVVYGLTSHNSVSSPSAASQALAASAAPTSTGSTPFVSPSLGQAQDNVPTLATMPKNSSAELSYSSFGHLPKGSRVTSGTVNLQVWDTLTGSATAKIIVSTPSDIGQPYAVPPGLCTPCNIPIDGSVIAPEWRDINSLTLRYDAATNKANGGGTASVDAIGIQATAASPVLEALSCTSAACPYFWDSSVNLNTFTHGTSYTPSVGWSVEINNASGTIFDRGVILRNLFVNVVASSTQTVSPFELPNGTPFGRKVEMTAYLDGTPKVRACVFYTDGTPSGQALPGYQVTVKRWQVLPPNAGASPPCTGTG